MQRGSEKDVEVAVGVLCYGHGGFSGDGCGSACGVGDRDCRLGNEAWIGSFPLRAVRTFHVRVDAVLTDVVEPPMSVRYSVFLPICPKLWNNHQQMQKWALQFVFRLTGQREMGSGRRDLRQFDQ